MGRLLSVLLMAFVFSGCVSAFKKACENTNWYEHGKKVAMSGVRFNADSFAKKCEAEDVYVDYQAIDLGFKAGMSKYCKPETVFQTGKSGKEFNPDLCDGSNLKVLRAKHEAGVRVYCKPENAHRLGSSGAGFNKICPGDLEPEFIKKYSEGRKKYLSELAVQKEKELRLLRSQERQVNRDLRSSRARLAKLPFVSEPKTDDKGNVIRPLSNRQRAILEERKLLDKEIKDLNSRLQSLRGQQRGLRTEISKMKAEAAAL